MKRFAITGTTSGIGFEVARKLNEKGHELILLNRSPEKAKSNKAHLPNPDNATLITCDLSNSESVKQTAETIKANYSRIDGLINNAGGIFPERQETEEGFEWTFAINHLGHFLLTKALLPLLEKGEAPRIINVSSEAHRQAEPNFDDLQMNNGYQSFKAYANAKLFNIYFTRSLAEMSGENGISSVSVHPGFVSTNFGRDFKGPLKMLLFLLRPFMINQEKGAATVLHLAEEDINESINGQYFKNKKPHKPAPIAFDDEKKNKLWELSEAFTKDKLE